MELSFELILDALMTVSLCILAVVAAALVLGWIVKLFCKFSGEDQPAFMSDYIANCYYMIFISGYVVGLLYQFYFVGFNDTSRIETAPAWIYQFHCAHPFNADHYEFQQEIFELSQIM